MNSKLSIAIALAALAVCAGSAVAAEAPRRDTLSLSASATVEVPRDTLTVRFGITKEGSDAGQVQSQLKQALDAALAEARKIAKPGAVEVQTGNFSLYPRYAPKGGINGWQGSAELVVEGRDMAAIAQLTGRVSSMNIASVGYSLSREAREKQESEVVAQAIARYKAKAADYARQFGYAGYQIAEVAVNADANVPMPMATPMARFKASTMADEALPVEAGKASVSATVSGTVLMGK